MHDYGKSFFLLLSLLLFFPILTLSLVSQLQSLWEAAPGGRPFILTDHMERLFGKAIGRRPLLRKWDLAARSREIRLSLDIGQASTLRSQLQLRLCLLPSVVFYRGLTMPVAIERDTEKRSNSSMITVNSGSPWPPMSKLFRTLLIKSQT